MKRIKYLLLTCLLIMAMALSACSGDSDEEETSGRRRRNDNDTVDVTGTPTEEVTPTSEPSPTSEVTPTAEPTSTPAPTEEITPTMTEPTFTPTPTEEPGIGTGKYAEEDLEYDKPEFIAIGIAERSDEEWAEDTENPHKVIEASFNPVLIGAEDKVKYPALAEALEYQRSEDERMIEDAMRNYRDMYTEYGECEDLLYFEYDSYNVLRSDSYVVSLENVNSSYAGGAHPYTAKKGISIDPATGDHLKISDICNDCDSLAEMIAYRLEAKYGLWSDREEDSEFFDGAISYIKEQIEKDRISFAVGNEGVTFYFSPYELDGTSYADGNLTATFSFYDTILVDEGEPKLVGLFKKKYRTVPDKYMRTLSLGSEVEVRNLVSDDDGEFDTLCVSALEYDEWGDFNGIGVQINGETVFKDESIFGYENDMYLYRNDIDETSFIIIHLVQTSEDDEMYVLAIGEDGKVTVAQNEEYGIQPVSIVSRYGEEEWDSDYSHKTLFDPDGFLAYVRNDLLGTTFVTGTYYITDEGAIARKGKYLDYRNGFELTLKQDFKAGMIDPDHMFNEDSDAPGEFDIEVELKAGEKIYPKKTDGDRRVFFTTDNGEWGMIQMDEGFGYLNGTGIWDIFDGINFAD